MRCARRALVAGTIAAVGLVACTNTTDVQRLTGHLPLVAFNGLALPAYQYPLPTVGLDGSVSHCDLLVSSGALDLRADGRYALYWQTTNSCTGGGLGAPSDSGAFSQGGDSIAMTVPRNYDAVWARVSASRVTVHYAAARTTLEFQR